MERRRFRWRGAQTAASRFLTEEGDGEDELHNVISRVKQRQYVLQSSLDTAGLLLPANKNLTHTSPSPAPLNVDTHTSTYTHIINWYVFKCSSCSCRVLPCLMWNAKHVLKSWCKIAISHSGVMTGHTSRPPLFRPLIIICLEIFEYPKASIDFFVFTSHLHQ